MTNEHGMKRSLEDSDSDDGLDNELGSVTDVLYILLHGAHIICILVFVNITVLVVKFKCVVKTSFNALILVMG